MSTVVFLGPSLDLATARSILPDAIFLPPAGQADLVSAVYRYQPRVIALIDGYFHQEFAVWHKEILHAFEHGVHVYGSSSMGALRAAELDQFGMIGVGEVYRRFASGELDADDEVTLVHGEADSGYRSLSVPLVNTRATLEDAVATGVISEETSQQFVAIAQSLHYTERNVHSTIERARAEGVDANTIDIVAACMREHPRNVKRDDAIELLSIVRDLPDDLPPKAIDYEVERPILMTAMLDRDRVYEHDGVAVTHAELAYHAALNRPDFNRFNFDTLNRMITVIMARRLGVTVEESDIDDESGRLRLRHRVTDDDKFERWLGSNDLTIDEFRELMEEVALCRRMHRWLLVRRHFAGTAKPIVDGMRLDGTYTAWVDSFVAEQSFVTDDIYDAAKDSVTTMPLRDLVLDQLRGSDCRMDAHFIEWAWEAGFPDNHALRVELVRSRQARANRVALASELGAILDDPSEPRDLRR